MSEAITKNDLKNILEEQKSIPRLSASNVYGQTSLYGDDIQTTLENDIYPDLFDTKGAIYSGESSNTIDTAGIDTHTAGASISVPAGTYIIIAQWIFNTKSATGTTNCQCSIRNNTDNNSLIAFQRFYFAAYNYNVMHAWTIVHVNATTSFSVCGSCSRTYTSATGNWIRAVRISSPSDSIKTFAVNYRTNSNIRSYNFAAGMTWEQWLQSPLASNDLHINVDDSVIVTSNNDALMNSEQTDFAYKTDLIVANCTYAIAI